LKKISVVSFSFLKLDIYFCPFVRIQRKDPEKVTENGLLPLWFGVQKSLKNVVTIFFSLF
jgi:hypothetical protein